MNKKIILGIVGVIIVIAIVVGVVLFTNKENGGIAIGSKPFIGESNQTILHVGKDIPAGKYAIKCTNTNYAMDVVVFSSEEEYNGFNNAERYTVGEFGKAVNAYSYAYMTIKEEQTGYINLKENYIIYLDKGSYEFNKYDIKSSNAIYQGFYVVGEDIEEGKYNIKCTTEAMDITVFDNTEKYDTYRKSERYTVGEEGTAISKNASKSKYLSKDKEESFSLRSGMIVRIEDGNGEYSITK